MNALEKKIVEIIDESLELKISEEQISSNQSLKDLGITSMEMISLIIEFEENFGISIETEEVFNLITIGEIADFIRMKSTQSAS